MEEEIKQLRSTILQQEMNINLLRQELQQQQPSNTQNKQNNTDTNTYNNNTTNQNNRVYNPTNTRPNLNNHNAGPPQNGWANQQAYNRSQPGQSQNTRPNYNDKGNSSKQTRVSHMSVDTQRNDSTPMEIGTLEENQSEEEVNFLIPCLGQRYP